MDGDEWVRMECGIDVGMKRLDVHDDGGPEYHVTWREEANCSLVKTRQRLCRFTTDA